MQENKGWRELCEQAAVEPDPERLLSLVAEMNQLLDEEQAQRDAKERSRGDYTRLLS